jgi:D-aminoacyl-tRNA deacylase
MPCLVYSTLDVASSNIAQAVKTRMDFEEAKPIEGLRHFTSEHVDMIEIESGLITADFIDRVVGADFAVFMSRHSSAKGIATFTTHAEGNWSEEAQFGGRPKSLGMASPANMLSMLCALKKVNTTGIPVMYEATHHGPLLNTPSFFVEIGGNAETIGNKEYADVVAESVVEILNGSKGEYGKVAIGIGGTHYPEKFTKLALEGKYAFAHMMPRYQINNLDMLQKAVERSDLEVEVAVIEWKSIKTADRDMVIERLGELGLDYERV